MRLLKRKYNQCDWIAKGISRQTGIPVIRNAVKRIHDNRTQTSLSTEERWENTEGIFRLTNPSLIAGRHILILDDVVTRYYSYISN
jgi:predicted amidophosphoribosyltransferase